VEGCGRPEHRPTTTRNGPFNSVASRCRCPAADAGSWRHGAGRYVMIHQIHSHR
jgi:hypothetical protein